MFQIGDYIVYPLHGAGVIEAIEEKEVLGKKREYCVMNFLINQLRVMIPIERMSQACVRKVADTETMKEVLKRVCSGTTDPSIPYKQRYKVNMEKLKTGRLEEEAEVIRDLMRMDKEKKLNSSEKTMLRDAQRYVVSEVELIKGVREEEAAKLLRKRMTV